MDELRISHRDLIDQAIAGAGGGWEIDHDRHRVDQARGPKDDHGADPWIRLRRPGSSLGEQGWKLHVSATPWAAPEILRRALGVLLPEDAPFKVAESTEAVLRLNDGAGGLHQVGKFVTVYPEDDEQAVRLARGLDLATRELRGPAIPGDRPLSPGSLVHYRFGPFRAPAGRESAEPLDAEELLAGERGRGYRPPDGLIDPFDAAGIAVREAAGPIAGRYAPLSTLYRSPRGSVHLGVDVQGGRACVLKRAAHDVRATPDGRDARDHLRHEHEVLVRMRPGHPVPAVYDLVEHGEDLVLVMERLDGETMAARVSRVAAAGDLPDTAQVVAWGLDVAAALEAIHADGIVWRDLNSANVILAPDGRIGLVDFELAQEVPGGAFQPGGSPGYSSPQQMAGRPGAVTDDLHSLGALLYFLATAVDPPFSPRPFDLLEVPIAAINPSIDPKLERVVARCLELEAAARYRSMAELRAELSSI